MIWPEDAKDYAANWRLSAILVAVGLLIEAAALVDIFLVRRAIRFLGGTMLIAGCILITCSLLLDWRRKRTQLTSQAATLLTLLNAGLVTAIAVVQFIFVVLAIGSANLRGFFAGPGMVVLIALILMSYLVESLVNRPGKAGDSIH